MPLRVKYVRKIKQLDSRTLRAMLHKAFIAGNQSYNLHDDEAGLEEKLETINKILLEHGLATPAPSQQEIDEFVGDN